MLTKIFLILMIFTFTFGFKMDANEDNANTCDFPLFSEYYPNYTILLNDL